MNMMDILMYSHGTMCLCVVCACDYVCVCVYCVYCIFMFVYNDYVCVVCYVYFCACVFCTVWFFFSVLQRGVSLTKCAMFFLQN